MRGLRLRMYVFRTNNTASLECQRKQRLTLRCDPLGGNAQESFVISVLLQTNQLAGCIFNCTAINCEQRPGVDPPVASA